MCRVVALLPLLVCTSLAAQSITPRASLVLGAHGVYQPLRQDPYSWLPQVSLGVAVGTRVALDIATRWSLGNGHSVQIHSLGIATMSTGPTALDFRFGLANIQTFSSGVCFETYDYFEPECDARLAADRGRIGVDLAVGVERRLGQHTALGATAWLVTNSTDRRARNAYQSIGVGLRLGWR